MTGPIHNLSGNSITYIDSGDSLDRFVSWLGDVCRVAIDTETTGLDTFEPGFEVRQICVGSADGTAFVFNGRDRRLGRSVLTAIKAAKRATWAHNAAYDARAIHAMYGRDCRAVRGHLDWLVSAGLEGCSHAQALSPGVP